MGFAKSRTLTLASQYSLLQNVWESTGIRPKNTMKSGDGHGQRCLVIVDDAQVMMPSRLSSQ